MKRVLHTLSYINDQGENLSPETLTWQTYFSFLWNESHDINCFLQCAP